ncbi:helix-hairpin-helix domain-containing protein [Bifidobacterium sp. 82T10]|uniref:Helix-hairpin-helix domain-containing protein n=2 Tax=Bifidobacterium miconis TaxID=2834435 RepID=A0ABS6WE26_9BIFI|nr:helix-hairpin-helix domain-containing protein [Bifidobacterium miconis]
MTSLHGIAGVRSGDGDAERHRIVRDRPRLAFRQIHALMAVLLLTAALCASLTMLLQQSLRYESALAETRAQLQPDESSSSGDSSDTTTSDGGRTGSSASASPSDTNDSSGKQAAQAGTDGGNGTVAGADDGVSGNNDANGTSAVENGGGDAATQSDGSAASGTATQPVNDGLIDLNTASAEELQTIKGIGPVTADRIIAYRKQIGRFSSVDQLLEVKGIGAKTLAKIRDQVAAR